MARAIEILQVDAFTSRPFGGNPAAVVLEADRLSDDDMRGIAGEMNLAETAFVSRTRRSDADLRLRWFTPTGREVTFCGHATVAAAHALDEAGRVGGDHVTFETLGGPLAVSVERAGRRRRVWLEPAVPSCAPYTGPVAEVMAALGATALGEWAEPAVTTEGDLLLPMPNLASLSTLAPDMTAIARRASADELRGVCVVAPEGVDDGSRTHSRFFAPHYGIPEDTVTGSVHAAIPVWLSAAGVLTGDGTLSFTAEQGDLLGRPGRLRIELSIEHGRPSHVRVGGEAVTVLTGMLRLG